MQWFQKNKEVVITVATFSIFLFSLILYGLLREEGNHSNEPPPQTEEEIRLELPASSAGETEGQEPLTTTSFLLHPGPAELLTKLENLNYQEFKAETRKLPGLRVMWPAYFFSIVKTTAGTAEVMFDASADGFGVLLITEISLSQYPQILTLERGRKIWLAGEITAVDPLGTGQFFLTVQYIRFDDYSPPSESSPQKTENIE